MTIINRRRFADLQLKESQLKYPSLPEYARSIKPYSDSTTNDLTKCVIKWITMHGYQAERISSSGRYVDNRKQFTDVLGRTKTVGEGKWIPSNGTKGTADISAIIMNKSGQVIPWKIEIKFGKDRQSDAQKKYEQSVINAGGKYSIIKTFDQFVEEWDKLIAGSS